MKTTKSQSRRRFPRLQLKSELGAAQRILEATVIVSGQERLAVFDLSYQGAAVQLSQASFTEGQQFELHLQLGQSQAFPILARIAWKKEKIMGIEFINLKLEDRLALDEFLEDQLIGSHLYPINASHFSKDADFQYWYHGPKGTNVFLWTKGNDKNLEIEKAMVEFDGQLLIFEAGQLRSEGKIDETSRDEEGLQIVLDASMPIVQRFVKVLSQIKAQEKPLSDLFDRLLRVP